MSMELISSFLADQNCEKLHSPLISERRSRSVLECAKCKKESKLYLVPCGCKLCANCYKKSQKYGSCDACYYTFTLYFKETIAPIVIDGPIIARALIAIFNRCEKVRLEGVIHDRMLWLVSEFVDQYHPGLVEALYYPNSEYLPPNRSIAYDADQPLTDAAEFLEPPIKESFAFYRKPSPDINVELRELAVRSYGPRRIRDKHNDALALINVKQKPIDINKYYGVVSMKTYKKMIKWIIKSDPSHLFRVTLSGFEEFAEEQLFMRFIYRAAGMNKYD